MDCANPANKKTLQGGRTVILTITVFVAYLAKKVNLENLGSNRNGRVSNLFIRHLEYDGIEVSRVKLKTRLAALLSSFLLLASECAERSPTVAELREARYEGTGMLWHLLSERHGLPESTTARDGLIDALQRSGVTFPEGATAVIEPSSGVLVMKNTAPNHERIKELLRDAGIEGEIEERNE